MLQWLWMLMMIAGCLYAAATGNLVSVGEALVSSAKETIALVTAMLGVVAVWCGLMEIAREVGVVRALGRLLAKPMRCLFPEIPAGHPAMDSLLLNITANILGLGWAATPAGIRGMEQLAALEAAQPTVPEGSASNSMCTFLILNISSLQLISANMLAYRAQYESAAPMACVVPAIVTTCVSTLAGIVFCVMMHKWTVSGRRRNVRGV